MYTPFIYIQFISGNYTNNQKNSETNEDLK
jgi:hypothetical protein